MDKTILRNLAYKYRTCFEQSDYPARLKLHRAVNDLSMIRPVVLMDELPWHQMNLDGSLTLQCEDAFLRSVEQFLRRNIFQFTHMPADMLLTPYVPIYKVIRTTDCGVTVDEHTLSQNDGNHIISHEYFDQLPDEAAIDSLHNVTITYDEALTNANFAQVSELIGDIIPAKIIGYGAYYAMWDDISQWRGVTPLFMDLYDRPDFTHKLMRKLTDITHDKIDQFERLNLFEPHPAYIHCTCATVSALPPSGFDAHFVKASDVWGRGMAQIFASVSPQMHAEFDIAYTGELLNRFGLSYYGCCEPLDNKLDILSPITNLRKVSVTPWASPEVSAQKIGRKLVFASKPNPAFVAETGFDAPRVRNEILRVLNACRENNCAVEFVLKDISHCGRLQNLIDWEKTAMDTVLNF